MSGKAIFSEEDTNEIVHQFPISMVLKRVIQINVPRIRQ